MHKGKQEQQVSNDSVLRHFILTGIFLYEALGKALNLIIPSPQKKKVEQDDQDQNQENIESSEFKRERDLLAKKSNEELKLILKGIDIISKLDKDQLINCVLSSQEAIEKLLSHERKTILFKMTISSFLSALPVEMAIPTDPAATPFHLHRPCRNFREQQRLRARVLRLYPEPPEHLFQ